MPEWQDVDESELVRESKKGEADAFGELYERYAPRLFRFLYAQLEDRLDAEDLTEEVFFKTWQFLPNYRELGAPFGGFLFRVARNLLVDLYRRSSRGLKEETLNDELMDGSHSNSAEIVSNSEELQQVMKKLREDYRTVLSLRFLAELTLEETAYAMGKSYGAVRVLQHRALLAARKAWRIEMKGEDDATIETT